jgi:ribosome-associated translation inhibitor RaiA
VNADRATVPIEVHAPDDLSRSERGEIRDRFARLARYTDEPIEELRLTLRHPETRAARLRWVADASLVLGGRRLAAHTAGSDALEAAKEAADRLERQMRRVADALVALRNDRRAIQRALAHVAHVPAAAECQAAGPARHYPAAHGVSVARVDARRGGGPARLGS